MVRKTNFLDSTAAQFYFSEYEIVDTWQCEKSETSAPKFVEVGDSVTFRSDGIFISTSTDLGLTGTYSYTGSNLSLMSQADNKYLLLKVMIEDNEMQWSGIDSNGDSFDYCFRKERSNTYGKYRFH